MNAVTPKRFAIAEYHRLIELGFLTEGDRIELIRGELIQMTAKGSLILYPMPSIGSAFRRSSSHSGTRSHHPS